MRITTIAEWVRQSTLRSGRIVRIAARRVVRHWRVIAGVVAVAIQTGIVSAEVISEREASIIGALALASLALDYLASRQSCRQAARHVQCVNNLKQIALGTMN